MAAAWQQKLVSSSATSIGLAIEINSITHTHTHTHTHLHTSLYITTSDDDRLSPIYYYTHAAGNKIVLRYAAEKFVCWNVIYDL